MKAILISIKPKWVAKILNGEKTIEIRKIMPKCDLPIDVYIYCTKNKELLHKNCADIYWVEDTNFKAKNKKLGLETQPYLNGKVVAKFTLNKVEEIISCKLPFVENEMPRNNYYYMGNQCESSICLNACLSMKDLELDNYLKGNIGYAWHISNLEIFDRPKELGEFRYATCPKQIVNIANITKL